MERKYILPAAITLTLHAFLLFGFTRHAPPPKKDSPKPPPEPGRLIVVPWAEPPKPIPSDQPSGPKTDVVPPSGLDQPNPDVRITDFQMPVEPWAPRTNVDIHAIPTTFSPDNGGEIARGHPPVVDFSGLDNTPHAKFQPSPQYPYNLRHTGERGAVLVEFVVDESGRVMNPRVLRSSNDEFDETTLHAVGLWRFEPGRKNGRVVRFRMSVPVKFDLTE